MHGEFREQIDVLTSGPLFPFSGGLHETLPLAACGVYTIWKGTEFLYVGYGGRKLDLSISHLKMKGLKDRLDSHWRGRRSGDSFAVYVFDRLIIPGLTDEQQKQFETGELKGDNLCREFIRSNLCYRFVATKSCEEARAIEDILREGQGSVGPPLLNPKKPKKPRKPRKHL